MIRTLSSEITVDSSHSSNKTNRVPYMGCQSLLYQNRITKETVIRHNKTMNTSMEEISNIPTSVLIHQSSPKSIPSFSTYHSDDTVFNLPPIENETNNNFDYSGKIYYSPPIEKSVTSNADRCNPANPNQSIHIRRRPDALKIQNSTSPSSNKGFLSSCVGGKSPSIHRSMIITSTTSQPDYLPSNNKFSTNDSSIPARPYSYQITNCWNDFISTFSSNGSTSIFWTRHSLKQPILKYVQKSQGKNAAKGFKVIQKYMGDRRTRKSPSQLIALLQNHVSFDETLRDEILIQICRQTINNPDGRSSSRGWELLSECLLQFSPSEMLYPSLEDFIVSSLRHEERKNSSDLNTSLTHLRKCLNNLSWPENNQKLKLKDSIDSSVITISNQKRKRSISESYHNGTHGLVIYSPQTLSGLMNQQRLSFPSEEIPLELLTICNQITEDIEKADSFLSLYRSFHEPKQIKQASINLEKWFNTTCKKGAHLIEKKSIPDLQSIALHVLIFWFESLSQPVISQQMAFVTNFSIKNLTKINKKVLLYMVKLFKIHVINKSKDNVRNIASFLCSLIFQLPKDKFYPLENPKDSVYMNIILPIFRNYPS